MREFFECQLIGGEWVKSSGEAFIPVENPADRSTIARVPDGTAEDVNRAVKAARKAFPAWSKTMLETRIRLMERMLEIFRGMTEEIVALEIAELGAPAAFARKKHCDYQMRRTAAFIDAARKMKLEEHFPSSLVTREPVGVVAAITPWNYPLGQIIQKAVPAILMGCTVALKPSELTPLTATLLAEAFREAGLPPGVFNLVQGRGETVGEALVAHPGVDMVSFTGSTRVGRRIGAIASRDLKRIALELGGKSPCVWLPGMSDYRPAAKKLFDSLLLNAGQTCTALSRLLVPEEMLGDAKALLIEALKNYPVGDPRDLSTRVGPVVSLGQFQRVKRYIESGLAEGAEIIAGEVPKAPGENEGYFIRPVVFVNVEPEMKIAQEEIFGPVLSVLTYRTLDEAEAIANGTPYGLCGAVFGPKQEALDFARRIRSGNVYINDAERDLAAPFGGFGASGIGREGGIYGLEEFTELKAVFDHSTF